ncbi:MAG: spiro-SPASM protein [Treponema sp.]|nr:spiro-SPASM protein [Treponema sp.]
MKTVTILFAHKNSKYMFTPVFNGLSSFEKALDWAEANKSEKLIVFAFDENKALVETNLKDRGEVYALPSWTTENLISEASFAVSQSGAEGVIFAWADCPFLNRNLTKEIFDIHTEFLSEYTFAEGYPYGFAPEMIDGGTLKIMKQLSETTQKEAASKEITRSSFYDFLKTDINAFEVETVLSDDDYRLLRFDFNCGKKENSIQCQVLFESLSDSEKSNLQNLNAEELSIKASKNVNILKTVPGFYNVQLSSKTVSHADYIPDSAPVNNNSEMKTDSAMKLVDSIAEFSENAVISLSYFGDPVNHPDFIKICEHILSYSGLSVFIETNFMTEEIVSALKKVADESVPRTNGFDKVMISVCLDAASAGTFSKIRRREEQDFGKTVENVSTIAKYFPQNTYPQFIRLNENEAELENFFRYWNEKTNPSNGNLIIQKYNSFCKTLPERKPADLSPVERNVCWHLRRDMNILANGDVSFCHCVYGKVIGNVFEKSLSEIWKASEEEIKNQSENKYCKSCGDCDEYYTFNF